MASETELVNVALALAGADRITTYDADSSKRGVLVRTVYPRVRDRLNASYRWNFAMTRADLGGEDAEAPVYGWTYKYTLPSDLLRLWETNILDPLPWVVESGKLLTDETDVMILYSRLVEAVDDMTEGFRCTLEYLLASQLSFALTRDMSVRDRLYSEYEASLQDSLATEAHESKPPQTIALDLISVRHASSSPWITLDV